MGAAAGALGAGIGSGMMAASAGSSFGAGFIGTQSAMTAISTSYTSSFLSGAAIGGVSGFGSGFTTGFGNGLMQGQYFGEAMWSGTKGGLIGGASGALLGGLTGGIQARRDGMDFWDGDITLEDRVNLISDNLSDEQWSEAGLSELKLGKNMGDANGRTIQGPIRYKLPDRETSFEGNTILLSKRTVRRIWNGRIRGIETLNHELQHATDFASGMYSRLWHGIGSMNSDLTRCVMEFRAFYMSFQRTGLSIYQTSYQHWYNQFYNLRIP